MSLEGAVRFTSLEGAVRFFLDAWDQGGPVEEAVKELRGTLPQIELYRAIYTSRSLLQPQEDEQLLERCVSNNAKLGVTGVLLREGVHYIQILEGHKPDIIQLLRIIKQDPRHTDFLLVKADASTYRMFPGWSMASASLSPAEYKMWIATFEAGDRHIDKLLTGFFEGRYRK